MTVRIVFYCPLSGYRNYAFSPATLESGVGGSESALIFISRALAKLGHVVSVYKPIDCPQHFEGVSYYPTVPPEQVKRSDLFILFRFFEPEFGKAPARVRVFWTTDIPTSEAPYRLSESLALADSVFAISPFHGKSLRAFALQLGVGKIDGKLWITSCGINAADYVQTIPKIRNQVLFCSVPDRGLRTMLDIWPRITSHFKDARLVITGDYSLWGGPPNNEEFRRMAVRNCGTTLLGRVCRTELVRHQLESELHVLPSDVPENFCISSMECQAAGTPTVSSGVGAMPTTVVDGRSGTIVFGDPLTRSFRSKFSSRIIELLSDRTRLLSLATWGRERALEQFDYLKIAQQWQEQFEGLLCQH